MQPTQMHKCHAHLLFSLSLGNSYEKIFLKFVNTVFIRQILREQCSGTDVDKICT